MRLSDFDFELPAELIAQRPTERRAASRLLVVRPGRPSQPPASTPVGPSALPAAPSRLGPPPPIPMPTRMPAVAPAPSLEDRRFEELPGLLERGDLLVFNDTRVIRARLFGTKESGGRLEALIERVTGSHEAIAMLRASKPPKPGSRIAWRSGGAEVLGRVEEFWRLRFDDPVHELLEREGRLPLPPYIGHVPDGEDERRYQTVYAREAGSVAAPTAGLHFDEAMLERLRERGMRLAWVTLHVGAGTFQPVRVEDLSEHRMHSERYQVPQATVDAIAETRRTGGRVIAVGTTSLRTLEGVAAANDGQVVAGAGETRLFVTPGFRFRVVDRLVTNFHLPKSTLLMLVSALAGTELIRRAYAHAIAQRYRFFSYGDAMLIDRQPQAGEPPPDDREGHDRREGLDGGQRTQSGDEAAHLPSTGRPL
jgi:S-adenosylmethionine:tRNA ribosyltransferase-isomerase